jgi:hypothetical protein
LSVFPAQPLRKAMDKNVHPTNDVENVTLRPSKALVQGATQRVFCVRTKDLRKDGWRVAEEEPAVFESPGHGGKLGNGDKGWAKSPEFVESSEWLDAEVSTGDRRLQRTSERHSAVGRVTIGHRSGIINAGRGLPRTRRPKAARRGNR